MVKIEMVDLKSQYKRIKPEIDQAIQKVIDSAAFIKGPEVGLLKDELSQYLGCKHTIPCANGTDALQIALMALDLKEGDEIITPTFTFIATVEVIALLKLKPVLVDVDPRTFNISPEAVTKAITPRTRAIIPVHLFGQAADMGQLMEISKKYNIPVIEDAAQSLGASYKMDNGTFEKVCNIGRISCTSFFPSKTLGCFGDGGAIFTNDSLLAEKMEAIANHGMKIRYHHEFIGLNSRIDTMQAAILRCKLPHLGAYIAARQNAAEVYDNGLSNLPMLKLPFRDPKAIHTFNQYTLIVNGFDRDKLKSHLQEKNIPSMVYYPVPLHLQQAFAYLGYKAGDFPVAENLCKNVISLPMHTELDAEQQQYIIQQIQSFFA